MNQVNKEQVFLATTSLEEFWDKSKRIVFLGEWCQRYKSNDSKKSQLHEIMPSPFSNKQKFYETYEYLNGIYEKLLPVLAESLNVIHEKTYSTAYWRIVLGPWLLYYIDIIYDRFLSVQNALERYPDLSTMGLAEECFIYPRNTEKFVMLASDDQYNLQLYTEIFEKLGKDYPRKTISELPDTVLQISSSVSFKRYAKNFLKIFYKIFKKRSSVVLLNSYFNIFEEFKFFFKTSGRIWPYSRENVELPYIPLNNKVRSKFEDIGFGRSEFETLLIKLLPVNIPQTLIESYKIVEEIAIKEYPSVPKAILSANNWFFDDIFKCWAALSGEKGAVLLGTQHGGNYGVDACMKLFEHERTVTDYYYTWGWSRTCSDPKLLPMPASKMLGRKKIGANNEKEGILYGGMCIPRYLYRFESFNNYDFTGYIDWQWRFVSSLSPELKAKMRVRLHADNHGWDLSQQWRDRYPEVPVETWEVPFLKSLDNCRVYVCDHLSTTYAEALSANLPVILFWNPQLFLINSEAKPYFDDLSEMGILHTNPESAAMTLINVYNDIEKWWNETQRQVVLRKFCKQFARVASDGADIWVNEFNKLTQNITKKKEECINDSRFIAGT